MENALLSVFSIPLSHGLLHGIYRLQRLGEQETIGYVAKIQPWVLVTAADPRPKPRFRGPIKDPWLDPWPPGSSLESSFSGIFGSWDEALYTSRYKAIADDVFSLFISEEVDKVELLYTKFVSLVKSDPVIHTLLPLSPKGEICDINGVCVDAAEDELFRLTTKEGKLTIERETVRTPTPSFSPILQFEQDPVQILDALLPLYLNSQILRALQESLASELAARMSAMSNATDNAMELKKNLSRVYNRQRQAKITGEILEIVAGADAQI